MNVAFELLLLALFLGIGIGVAAHSYLVKARDQVAYDEGFSDGARHMRALHISVFGSAVAHAPRSITAGADETAPARQAG